MHHLEQLFIYFKLTKQHHLKDNKFFNRSTQIPAGKKNSCLYSILNFQHMGLL